MRTVPRNDPPIAATAACSTTRYSSSPIGSNFSQPGRHDAVTSGSISDSHKRTGGIEVPAVGDQQEHGLAAQHAPPPVGIEGANRLADPRAAGPVMNGVAEPLEHEVEAPFGKLGGDPRQARREHEHLDPPLAARH